MPAKGLQGKAMFQNKNDTLTKRNEQLRSDVWKSKNAPCPNKLQVPTVSFETAIPYKLLIDNKISLAICLYVCLSVTLCLSVCLSVNLSVCVTI